MTKSSFSMLSNYALKKWEPQGYEEKKIMDDIYKKLGKDSHWCTIPLLAKAIGWKPVTLWRYCKNDIISATQFLSNPGGRNPRHTIRVFIPSVIVLFRQ